MARKKKETTTTMPTSKPTECVETIKVESDSEVTPTVENVTTDSIDNTEGALKDAWGRPIPTKKVLFEGHNFNTIVNQVLYAASLGAELDYDFNIRCELPFRVQVLMPQDKYAKYLANEDYPVYDEKKDYLHVLVKGLDRYKFFGNLITVGKAGASVEPSKGAQRRPFYSVPTIVRNPVEDKQDIKVGYKKIAYTQEELESFNIAQLSIIGGWWGLSFRHKNKYVEGILKAQGVVHE